MANTKAVPRQSIGGASALTGLLAIGAHPDDVELGCGATLLRARRAGIPVTIVVLTDGQRGPGDAELRRSEQHRVASDLDADLVMLGMPDGQLKVTPALVDQLAEIIATARADTILTHSPADTHQDHRATAEATMAAARSHKQLLHYESPTTVGFAPTIFSDVTGLVEDKLNLLRRHQSQVDGSARVDLDVIAALATVRGRDARVKAAEAFMPLRAQFAIGLTLGDFPHAATVSARLTRTFPSIRQERAL